MRYVEGVWILVVSLWIALFFWMSSKNAPCWGHDVFYGQKRDYYNLLVDNFQRGHLYMDIDPERDGGPRLENLQDKPHLVLDSAYFKHRYYLYYGAAPAVLLLLPYSLITGQDLGLNAAVFFFVAVGFLASSVWWRSIVHFHVKRFRCAAIVLGITILAFFPGVLFLLRRSSFYDLPIASGYAFICLLVIALWRAIQGGGIQPWLWASLFFGLAVASRANLILCGVAFIICAIGTEGSTGQRCFRLLAAALPAGIIGVVLGWYNCARFGSPFDFGFSYGMNDFFSTGNPLYSFRFIVPNIRWYFLSPPHFAPWFPFVFPISGPAIPFRYSNAEEMHGSFIQFLITVFVVVSWGLLVRRHPLGKTYWWLAAVLFVFLVELIFMSLLGIRAYRYATEFLTPLSFIVVFALIPIFAIESKKYFAAIIVISAGTAVLACLGTFSAIQLFDLFRGERRAEFALLSRQLNPDFSKLQWKGAKKLGPMRMVVRFSRPEQPTAVPLVCSGLPHQYDELRAMVDPSAQVRFDFFHHGYGGPTSEYFPVEWGRDYSIECTMGSLYPPSEDKFFSGTTKAQVKRIKTLGTIVVDGELALSRQMVFYESAPWVREPQDIGDCMQYRCVQIVSRQYGINSPIISRAMNPDLGCFSCNMAPMANQTRSVPLLCLGITGQGNLLYLESLQNGNKRMSLDCWGIGILHGREFGIPKNGSAKVEMFVGPAQNVHGLDDALADRLLVWVDGILVVHFRLKYHLQVSDMISLGENSAEFSSAEPAFIGRLKLDDITPVQKDDIARRAREAVATGVQLQVF